MSTSASYADDMADAGIEGATTKLLDFAATAPTTYMCAEKSLFKCHRMLVSDRLVAHDHEVLHIDAPVRQSPITYGRGP